MARIYLLNHPSGPSIDIFLSLLSFCTYHYKAKFVCQFEFSKGLHIK